MEIRPFTPSPLLGGILSEAFAPFRVSLFKNRFTDKSGTHDFGVEIQALFLAKISDTITKNMQGIAALEGFKLEVSNHYYFPRDHMIPVKEQTLALSGCCFSDWKKKRLTSCSGSRYFI